MTEGTTVGRRAGEVKDDLNSMQRIVTIGQKGIKLIRQQEVNNITYYNNTPGAGWSWYTWNYLIIVKMRRKLFFWSVHLFYRWWETHYRRNVSRELSSCTTGQLSNCPVALPGSFRPFTYNQEPPNVYPLVILFPRTDITEGYTFPDEHISL